MEPGVCPECGETLEPFSDLDGEPMPCPGCGWLEDPRVSEEDERQDAYDMHVEIALERARRNP